MHIHILGICGAFMGGVAAIARQAGHRVTGCDANVYPPMSEPLAALDIELIEGYGEEQLHDLMATINAVPSDVIIVASPVDLRRLLRFDRPSFRVSYEVEVVSGPTLEEVLLPLKEIAGG